MQFGVMTVNIRRLPGCPDEEWGSAVKTMQHAYEIAKTQFSPDEGTPRLIVKNDVVSAQIISDQDVPSASTKEWAESEYAAGLRQYGITHVSVWVEYTQLVRGDTYGR